MRKGLVALLVLIVAACVPLRPPQPPHVTIEDDEFSPQATVVGVSLTENTVGGVLRKWFLRSFVDKRSHAVTHQLYVNLSYNGDRMIFNRAADDTATPLPVVRIDRSTFYCDRKVDVCTRTETIGVELSDAELRARAASGFRIKISAHSGDALILPITPEMISLQLAAVDNLRQAAAGPPAK